MKDCIIELQEISDELYEEKKELQNLINQNLFQIEKINVYLKGLFEKEDSDFKVFSPRNIETVYSEQIEMNNEQKKMLESDNVVHYKKLNILNRQIDKLSEVISKMKEFDLSEETNINNTLDEKHTDIIVQEKENVDSSNIIIDKDSFLENSFTDNIQQKENAFLNNDIEMIEEKNIESENKEYLKHVSHQIRNAVSILNVDVQRAKTELTSLANKLDME